MSLIESWRLKGQCLELSGKKVFYIDTGGDKPAVCILHGYPTSSLDYYKVLEPLSEYFRVVVHDHLGFGMSEKPKDYSYSLVEQADIATALWQALGITQCALVSHDYGTSVTTEIMHRVNIKQYPISINGVVLSNGSMHIELAQLKWMQKLLRRPLLGKWIARLASYATFKRNIKSIYFNSNVISESELKANWTLLNCNYGKAVLPMISQYTYERWRFWNRWIGAIINYNSPIHLIWAKNDPVAVDQIAIRIEQEAQDVSLYWIDNCGHFPMLEKPQEWVEQVIQSVRSLTQP